MDAPARPPEEFLPLTVLLPELRQISPDLPARLNYRCIYNYVIDGKIVPPIERRNGRWGCIRRRLPTLAAALVHLTQGVPDTGHSEGHDETELAS